MPKADPLEQARRLLHERLADLEEERERIERGLRELGGDSRPRRARKAAADRRPAGGKKRRRGRKGTRADQVLAEIGKHHGETGTEIAKRLGVEPNYLYRVIGDLEKEGKINKKGRQLFPNG